VVDVVVVVVDAKTSREKILLNLFRFSLIKVNFIAYTKNALHLPVCACSRLMLSWSPRYRCRAAKKIHLQIEIRMLMQIICLLKTSCDLHPLFFFLFFKSGAPKNMNKKDHDKQLNKTKTRVYCLASSVRNSYLNGAN